LSSRPKEAFPSVIVIIMRKTATRQYELISESWSRKKPVGGTPRRCDLSVFCCVLPGGVPYFLTSHIAVQNLWNVKKYGAHAGNHRTAIRHHATVWWRQISVTQLSGTNLNLIAAQIMYIYCKGSIYCKDRLFWSLFQNYMLEKTAISNG